MSRQLGNWPNTPLLINVHPDQDINVFRKKKGPHWAPKNLQTSQKTSKTNRWSSLSVWVSGQFSCVSIARCTVRWRCHSEPAVPAASTTRPSHSPVKSWRCGDWAQWKIMGNPWETDPYIGDLWWFTTSMGDFLGKCRKKKHHFHSDSSPDSSGFIDQSVVSRR